MDVPEEDAPEGAPDWLVTFSDLVSLLVTLFIMMLTFTTQETDDLSQVMDMIKGSFGIMPAEVKDKQALLKTEIIQNEKRHGVTRPDLEEDPSKDPRIRELTGFIVDESDLDKGIRIVPETASAFGKGDPRPSTELEGELRRLARALKKHKSRTFRIEGHTDTETDKFSRLPGMDELALERARRVAQIFGLEGVQLDAIRVTSRASRSPRDKRRNELAYARNRRIEIVIEPLAKADKGK